MRTLLFMQLLEETSSTSNYGRTRLFGSAGWGVCAPLAGLVLDAAGPQALLLTSLACALAAAALAWWLPLEQERWCRSQSLRETDTAVADTNKNAPASQAAQVAGQCSENGASSIDSGLAGDAVERPPLDAHEVRCSISPAIAVSPEVLGTGSNPCDGTPETESPQGRPEADPSGRQTDMAGIGKPSPPSPTTGESHAHFRALLRLDVAVLLMAVSVMGMLSAYVSNFQFIFLKVCCIALSCG